MWWRPPEPGTFPSQGLSHPHSMVWIWSLVGSFGSHHHTFWSGGITPLLGGWTAAASLRQKFKTEEQDKTHWTNLQHMPINCGCPSYRPAPVWRDTCFFDQSHPASRYATTFLERRGRAHSGLCHAQVQSGIHFGRRRKHSASLKTPFDFSLTSLY